MSIGTKDTKTEVFIVYTGAEVALAAAIKRLLEHRGIPTFYCRQEQRALASNDGYRTELEARLRQSTVVLVLASREFRSCPYGQAEVGMAIGRKAKVIVVLVPPAKMDLLAYLVPIIGGKHGVPITEEEPGIDPSHPSSMASRLRTAVEDELKLQPRQIIDDIDRANHIAFSQAVGEIKRTYDLMPSVKEEFRLWPSIDGKSPQARRSIIENLKRSLGRSDRISSLQIAGVSLKWSLELITDALEEIAPGSKSPEGPIVGKTLHITLVHMDDHAHVLHALDDKVDINYIRDNFDVNWAGIWSKWTSLCAKAGITLAPPSIHRIDYIPPRVGVLVDDDVFYAGRCAFRPTDGGGSGYQLWVGEREYFLYTTRTTSEAEATRARNAIYEFKGYLGVYKQANHNGVLMPKTPTAWIEHLSSPIECYAGIERVTLISQTCTKFRPLVKKALAREIPIDIYVQDIETAPTSARNALKELRDRIPDDAEAVGYTLGRGLITVRHFRQHPTYRAALIGNRVLGAQMYVGASQRPTGGAGVAAGNSERTPTLDEARDPQAILPGELRLIATQHSAQYLQLRKELVDRFVKRVPEKPVAVW
ncbi:MAG TPA: toll/interleukin-1 receptor domain-containing protein [Polyangia bacterium]|nr:toll/interleukin-1 receptor domain-containing protein [Polyangia bacterium]